METTRMADVTLEISPQLKKLLNPLSGEEFKQLEANIVADKRVIDPILYWDAGDRNWIVDGMHRFEIAEKHKIPFNCEPMEFESLKDAEIWLLRHEFGRRHFLNPLEFKKAVGELYNRLKRDDEGHGDQKS